MVVVYSLGNLTACMNTGITWLQLYQADFEWSTWALSSPYWKVAMYRNMAASTGVVTAWRASAALKLKVAKWTPVCAILHLIRQNVISGPKFSRSGQKFSGSRRKNIFIPACLLASVGYRAKSKLKRSTQSNQMHADQLAGQRQEQKPSQWVRAVL